MAVALLAAAAVLTGLVACDSAGTRADASPSAAALHLTQADWQVQTDAGFTSPPLTLDGQTLPDRWQPVTLPHALSVALLGQARAAASAGVAPVTRTSWFRLTVPPAPPSSTPLALYAARVRTDGTLAVYADGHLVHTAQQQGPLWNSPHTPLWVLLKRSPDGQWPREITLRIEHTAATQVALSSLWLGPVDTLSWRYHGRQWLQQELPGMFSSAFLAVGIFALLVWLRRRHEPGYLLFFVLAAMSFIRGLHFYVNFPIANDWFAWLTVNSLFWLVTMVHFSIGLLHRRQQRWLTRALITASVLMALLTLPLWPTLPNTPRTTPLLYAVTALMGVSVSVAGIINAWGRSRDAMVVAIGTVLATLFSATDWLVQSNFISPENWYLGAHTNAITFSVFGYVMYRRYTGAIAQVEQVNANLAKSLRDREAELAISYERMSQIERSQTLSNERQRLTQDMHDGLGSSLISALRVVEGGRLGEADVAEVLKACIDDLKLTIDSMEPVEADLLLLLATLRFRLGPRLAAAGITLRWEVVDLPALDWLDPRNALHILRILQEAFANILKHTQATEIRVSTGIEKSDGVDGVRVTISDNGQGFVLETALGSGGKGLQNQLRRAQFIGAKLRWETDDKATCLHLWLPENRTRA
ncbi:MAG: 7TM diverse intracellular signaling domain-containing protein [Rhodoferax sp.]|nr:7TM diverse intracellular signaling domain-containing protein [Rhodoferax sp.]